MNTKNLALIIAAVGAYLMLSRNGNAMARTNIPGATPVMGGYLRSPAYGGQSGVNFPQQASAQSWGDLGSALGNVFNKITGNNDTPASTTTNGAGSRYPSASDSYIWQNDGYPGGTTPDLQQYIPGSQSGMGNFYG